MRQRTRQDENKMRQQVSPWFEKRNLPPVLFDKLKPYNKVVLHHRICVGIQAASDRQLRDLYDDLVGLSATRGEGDYPTNEDLRKYFSPDGIPYQKKW